MHIQYTDRVLFIYKCCSWHQYNYECFLIIMSAMSSKTMGRYGANPHFGCCKNLHSSKKHTRSGSVGICARSVRGALEKSGTDDEWGCLVFSLHSSSSQWSSVALSLGLFEFLCTKLIKPCLHGPGFVHEAILEQKRFFNKNYCSTFSSMQLSNSTLVLQGHSAQHCTSCMCMCTAAWPWKLISWSSSHIVNVASKDTL